MLTQKKIRIGLVLTACVSWMLWLVSCQQPESEIELPEPKDAFTKSDLLGNYLNRISLLDGSVDNVIDNASCLSVVYPVDISVKGVSQTVNSTGDLTQIIEEYNLNPYYPEFMAVDFPITVKTADHTQETVANQQELNSLKSACREGGTDTDIECLDFNYPITLSIYDLENQSANTREVRGDQSLHNVLGGLSEEDLISLDFPVSLSSGNVDYTVNDHVELQQVVEMEASGCDEGDKKYYSEEEIPLGLLEISLTDAPFPIEFIAEANVTITEILVKTGAENDSVPFITLFKDTVTYNLLELTNGITEELSNTPLPAGNYKFFRIFVENGEVVLTDGRSFDLKVPSGSSSGILVKPDQPISITADASNVFLFDFDLSRSFIPKGNPKKISTINGFNFRPVIKASNTSMTGILKGEVTDESENMLEDVQITVYAADTVNTTAFTDEEGSYKILGLTPGIYKVEAELEGFETYQSEKFNINQGEATILNISLE